MTDPLLRFRGEFPILERTTYLVSNSLGAMPRATPGRLAEYADSEKNAVSHRGRAARRLREMLERLGRVTP